MYKTTIATNVENTNETITISSMIKPKLIDTHYGKFASQHLEPIDTDSFIPSNENDGNNIDLIGEHWLESQFQQNFKRLNTLINKTTDDTSDQLLFLKRQDDPLESIELPKPIEPQQTKLKSKCKNETKEPSINKRYQWLDCRIDQLEQLTNGNNYQLTETNIDTQLICLIVTEPNEKLNHDPLLYQYPIKSSNRSNETDSILKLGGMFITLSDIFDNLLTMENGSNRTKYRNDTETNNQFIPSTTMQTFRIIMKAKNHLKCYYRFTIVPSRSRSNRSKTILMLIGIPDNDQWCDDRCQSIARLASNLIEQRFGPLHELYRSIDTKRLDHLFQTLDLLISIPHQSMPQSIRSSPSSNRYQFELLMHGTLINFQFQPSIDDRLHLPIQRLCLSSQLQTQIVKLLNYYDSLDWLDESITRFYSRTNPESGFDLENALSEHFVRCLQWDSNQPNGGIHGSIPTQLMVDGSDKDDQSSITLKPSFDLLELELSTFVVLGSTLFFRGQLLQSNLSNEIISNVIIPQLYSNSLLTLFKNRRYNLCYFTRTKSSIGQMFGIDKPQGTHIYLLIIGDGHFLHCSIIHVYNIDNHRSIEQNREPISPSPFAFYVFIKESFRFICQTLNEPESPIKTCSTIVNDNISMQSITELIETLYLSSSFLQWNLLFDLNLDQTINVANNNNEKKKDKPKKTKKKEQKLRKEKNIVETKPKQRPFSFIFDRRSSIGRNPLESNPESILRLNQLSTPSNLNEQSQSIYDSSSSINSNTNCSSILTHSSTASETCSETCDCDDHYSLTSSCGTDDSGTTTMDELNGTISSTGPTIRTECRLIQREHPLMSYLLIRSNIEQLYGPIFDHSIMKQCSIDQCTSTLMSNLIGDIIEHIMIVRRELHQQTKHECRRRNDIERTPSRFHRNQRDFITNGDIVDLSYDANTGNGILPIGFNSSLIVSYQIYLIGRCYIRLVNDTYTIGDEFYACYKLTPNGINRNILNESSYRNRRLSTTESKESNNNRWSSFGRLSFRLDSSRSSKTNHKRSSSSSMSTALKFDQSMIIDSLRNDFDELIQSILLDG